MTSRSKEIGWVLSTKASVINCVTMERMGGSNNCVTSFMNDLIPKFSI